MGITFELLVGFQKFKELNWSEFNILFIYVILKLHSKNVYGGDKIGEKKFFANMNTCWATVEPMAVCTVYTYTIQYTDCDCTVDT